MTIQTDRTQFIFLELCSFSSSSLTLLKANFGAIHDKIFPIFDNPIASNLNISPYSNPPSSHLRKLLALALLIIIDSGTSTTNLAKSFLEK